MTWEVQGRYISRVYDSFLYHIMPSHFMGTIEDEKNQNTWLPSFGKYYAGSPISFLLSQRCFPFQFWNGFETCRKVIFLVFICVG